MMDVIRVTRVTRVTRVIRVIRVTVVSPPAARRYLPLVRSERGDSGFRLSLFPFFESVAPLFGVSVHLYRKFLVLTQLSPF